MSGWAELGRLAVLVGAVLVANHCPVGYFAQRVLGGLRAALVLAGVAAWHCRLVAMRRGFGYKALASGRASRQTSARKWPASRRAITSSPRAIEYPNNEGPIEHKGFRHRRRRGAERP